MFVTALEVAESRGMVAESDGSGYSGAAFERVGIPFIGGCYNCHGRQPAERVGGVYIV